MAISLLMAVMSGTSFANSLEKLMECSQTKDSLVRLVCYDNVVKSLNQNKNTTMHSTATTDKTLQVKSAVIKTKKEQPEVASKEDKFGSEHLVSTIQKKKSELDKVTFTIKSAKKVVHNKWKVTFNNEQVWKQSGSEYIKLAAGDQVELSKGAFGSFHLKKLDGNRSIRVKRTK